MNATRLVFVGLLVTLWTAPAFAQVDLTGMWRPMARDEDGSGLDGDYSGLPLNASGRARAQAWAPENFEVPEWVCRPHVWDFSLEAGASQLRISAEIEDATQRLIALRGRLSMREQELTIWMDGRPRPSEAARHSWSGFATGEWEGNTLVQTTTHLKEAYIRRSGAMKSDQATTRIRYKRIGNYLRATVIMYDPVYLEEPYIRTSLFWINDPTLILPAYPCEEATETVVERGTIPHYMPGESLLPGQNPKVTDTFGTPYEARLGGAETMYPEYIAKMKTSPRPPEAARQHTGWKPPIPSVKAGEVEVVPVRGKVYMLVGAGANITVHAGDDEVLLVDVGIESMSDTVLAAVRRISNRPLRYIINTNERIDHTGGNAKLAAAGSTIPFRIATDPRVSDGRMGQDRANVVSYLTVFHRMSAPTGQQASRPEAAWPDNTYSTPQKKLFINDEPVLIVHFPSTTDGDSIVHFRTSDVVSAGDLLDLTRYPLIDVKAGGSVQSVVDSLNRLIDITVPNRKSEAGTLVIPGHGRLADQPDVAYYREMVTIVRDRVRNMIAKGMTLQQITAARPTLDFDTRYGRDGAWTPAMFVEAVYQSLKK